VGCRVLRAGPRPLGMEERGRGARGRPHMERACC